MSNREVDKTAPNFYDKVEIHTGVAVQILTNSKTGKVSIGWSKDADTIKEWTDSCDSVN